MGLIDYSLEPKSDIAFVDIKSFYASVECVKRNLNPLTTSLCVMSNSDNASGLILASSPTFKKVFGKKTSVGLLICLFTSTIGSLTSNQLSDRIYPSPIHM